MSGLEKLAMSGLMALTAANENATMMAPWGRRSG